MCGLEVDLEATADRFGVAGSFSSELAALAPMVADGLVEVKGRRIRVTDKGRPWMRTVAALFDRYLETGEVRHSRAV